MNPETENSTPIKKKPLFIKGTIGVCCVTLLCIILFETPDDYVLPLSLAGYFVFVPLLFVMIDVLLKRVSLKTFLIFGVSWFVATIIISPLVLDWFLANRPSRYSDRSLLTLMALGKGQRDYWNEHDHEYGTWSELTDVGFLQEGYSRSNIIDNYSICAFDARKSTRNEDGNIVEDSSFRIVAIPRSQRNKLRTFAINDTQQTLVWIGDDNLWSVDDIDLSDKTEWKQHKYRDSILRLRGTNSD